MKKLIEGTPEEGFDITSKGTWILKADAELTSEDKVVLDEFAGVKHDSWRSTAPSSPMRISLPFDCAESTAG